MLSTRNVEPGLPERLTPSQAAQLAELLEFFHGQFGTIIESVRIPENAATVQVDVATWQVLLAIVQPVERIDPLRRKPGISPTEKGKSTGGDSRQVEVVAASSSRRMRSRMPLTNWPECRCP